MAATASLPPGRAVPYTLPGEAAERHLAARCAMTTGWTIVTTQSLAPLDEEAMRQLAVALGWRFTALLVAVAVTIAIARHVTRPLESLSSVVSAFHPHGAVPSIVASGREPAEIVVLLDRFNAMASRANESDHRNHEALAEVRRVQVELAHVLAQRESEIQARTMELATATRTADLAAASAKLEQPANSDPLTGLANRRAMVDSLDTAWRMAARELAPLSALAIDVDHFKGYNDTLGHPAGDACLQRVAQVLESAARRPLDGAGRTGGEEFLAVLYDAPADSAHRIAERLRSTVEALAISHPAAPDGRVTVSIGVATVMPGADVSPTALLEAADAGLYEAKRTGRNRVAVCEPALAPTPHVA